MLPFLVKIALMDTFPYFKVVEIVKYPYAT